MTDIDMTNEEAISIIRREYLCVDRECDRSCGNCDLMLPSKEPILQAYKVAIKALEQEPKTDGDCISREKTLEKFCDYVGSGMSMDDFDALYDIVSKMPSVQPMTGHWINNVNGTYTCDHCGCKHSRSNYCPNCGYKMEE